MTLQSGSPPQIPPTVPKELVWDQSLDAFSSELDDPFTSIGRLHDGPGIIFSTNARYGRPGWVATRYDVISEIFLDHEHFSAERPSMFTQLLGEDIRLNPLEVDPPAHHGFRQLLAPFFTPKAIKLAGASIRGTCQVLISKFEGKGGCEFIQDFAVPFPSYIFLDLMGMPRERLPEFLEWEHVMFRSPEPMDRVHAARSVHAYLKEFLAEQRRKPSNDLVRAIIEGQIDGCPIDHLEVMGILFTLYLGGLDSVYSTLGWVLRCLATQPELQQRLRDNPEDIPAAVEEFSRAFSVITTHRTLVDDYDFHGVPLRKGEEIILPVTLANRDPRVFPDPHVIDIDRKPRHINFGTGIHSCLGVHLAKREMRLVIEEFLGRFRNIRIRSGETYRFHTAGTFGIDYLPIVWDAAG